MKSIFKEINYKLWLVLFVGGFIPLIYSTTRIHFLGNIPNEWSFSIASQIAWLNIGYEIIYEGLIIPLAFILGQVIKKKNAYAFRISTTFFIVFIVYFATTFFVLLFTPELVTGMKQSSSLIKETITYIRLESIAILFSSIFAFFKLVLVLKNNLKALYILLTCQTILILFGDTFLVSQLSFSLSLGVNGIAITNILVNSILSLISIYYLKKEGLKLSLVYFFKQKWILSWFKIGFRSGLESFVRNFAFLVMILQLINEVQQADIYWITNNFIWGWLLLPVLSLGELIKQDAAINNGITTKKINTYFILTIGIIGLWFISTPLWNSFIYSVMGVKASLAVTELATLLVIFYAIFALNNVIDSYFYGIGRTDLMLYQSLIVNCLFYGSAFVAYKLGLFVPSLKSIAVMFGLSMTFDALITYVLYVLLRKNRLIGNAK